MTALPRVLPFACTWRGGPASNTRLTDSHAGLTASHVRRTTSQALRASTGNVQQLGDHIRRGCPSHPPVASLLSTIIWKRGFFLRFRRKSDPSTFLRVCAVIAGNGIGEGAR
eukprot:365276-Chlamydomonas_euryale.AAC.5